MARSVVTCDQCGREFPTSYPTRAKRCSDECRSRAASLRATEWNRTNKRRKYADTRTCHYTPARRARTYGITVAEVEAMEARFDAHGCDLCGTKRGKACIDHDHVTGIVRGILCQPCNTAIGVLGDTPEGLQAALDYLEGSR